MRTGVLEVMGSIPHRICRASCHCKQKREMLSRTWRMGATRPQSRRCQPGCTHPSVPSTWPHVTLQRARRAQRSRRFQRWSKGAASRRKYNAREVWEREWPRGPRVFCPSGDPSFLARWRVCGRPAVRGPARRGRAPSNALPSFHNRRS
jgi:hypothetical protein